VVEARSLVAAKNWGKLESWETIGICRAGSRKVLRRNWGGEWKGVPGVALVLFIFPLGDREAILPLAWLKSLDFQKRVEDGASLSKKKNQSALCSFSTWL
jgi:hypothetical protein